MGVTEHISKQFEEDLDSTRTRVLQMGGLVEAQILAATDAYMTGNAELIEQVIENDRRVNGYEVAIDGACSHIVVKRQPAASDLRLIMGISKIVTDLERSGDEAEKIARMARAIHEHGGQHAQRFPAVRHAAQVAVKMLREALDAFRDLGARPLEVDPERHDTALARTSHLPYLVSCALRAVGGEAFERGLSGPGFRDMTRLAASDPRIAGAYCRANAREVAAAWRDLREAIDRAVAGLDISG